jgi:hypothetical protein
MKSMLDAIVDLLITGDGPVTVTVLDSPCEYPDLTSETSYHKGCRCHRCATAHNAAASRWNHRTGEQP